MKTIPVVVKGETRYIPTKGDKVLEAFGRTFGTLREVPDEPTTREPEAPSKEKRMSDFENDVMVKLTEIEQGLGTVIAKLGSVGSAPAGAGYSGGKKAAQLTDIQTASFKVKSVFEDDIKGKTKWNIIFVDGAGLSKKMGTWDEKLGTKAKAAKTNNTAVNVTFGNNKNGYAEISDIQ